jgi:hypothetical protein
MRLTERTLTKEYNKLSKRKEELVKFFDEYFGSPKKSIRITEEQLTD